MLHSLYFVTQHDHVLKKLNWDLLTPPPGSGGCVGGDLHAKYFDRFAAFLIPFYLIWNMKLFWKSCILTPWVRGGVCGQIFCLQIPTPSPSDPGYGVKMAKFQLFQNSTMLHIKFKGIRKCSNNFSPEDPSPDPGDGVNRSKFVFFSTCLYQIKWDHKM